MSHRLNTKDATKQANECGIAGTMHNASHECSICHEELTQMNTVALMREVANPQNAAAPMGVMRACGHCLCFKCAISLVPHQTDTNPRCPLCSTPYEALFSFRDSNTLTRQGLLIAKALDAKTKQMITTMRSQSMAAVTPTFADQDGDDQLAAGQAEDDQLAADQAEDQADDQAEDQAEDENDQLAADQAEDEDEDEDNLLSSSHSFGRLMSCAPRGRMMSTGGSFYTNDNGNEPEINKEIQPPHGTFTFDQSLDIKEGGEATAYVVKDDVANIHSIFVHTGNGPPSEGNRLCEKIQPDGSFKLVIDSGDTSAMCATSTMGETGATSIDTEAKKAESEAKNAGFEDVPLADAEDMLIADAGYMTMSESNETIEKIILLTILVDISGSMAGLMTQLRDMLCKLVSGLDPQIIASIILFDSYAEQAAPAQQIRASTLPSLCKILESIHARGSTNLINALSYTGEVFMSTIEALGISRDRVEHDVILFTDGEPDAPPTLLHYQSALANNMHLVTIGANVNGAAIYRGMTGAYPGATVTSLAPKDDFMEKIKENLERLLNGKIVIQNLVFRLTGTGAKFIMSGASSSGTTISFYNLREGELLIAVVEGTIAANEIEIMFRINDHYHGVRYMIVERSDNLGINQESVRKVLFKAFYEAKSREDLLALRERALNPHYQAQYPDVIQELLSMIGTRLNSTIAAPRDLQAANDALEQQIRSGSARIQSSQAGAVYRSLSQAPPPRLDEGSDEDEGSNEDEDLDQMKMKI